MDFAVDVRIQCERYSTQIPKYVHAVSNIPQAQVLGLFKGAIIRCIDCASNEEMCFKSLINTAAEFRFVKFGNKQFCAALRAVSKQYELLQPFARYLECKFGK